MKTIDKLHELYYKGLTNDFFFFLDWMLALKKFDNGNEFIPETEDFF